tara:strand:- start:480 stop:3197 length:2718 start_codon:yes stop_codon:yes gene_type:complete
MSERKPINEVKANIQKLVESGLAKGTDMSAVKKTVESYKSAEGYTSIELQADQSTLYGTAKQFAQPFSEITADALDILPATAEWGFNKVFGDGEQPAPWTPEARTTGGRFDWNPASMIAQKIRGNMREPQGSTERVAERAGEFVKDTLPMVAMPGIKAAQTGVKAIQAAAPTAWNAVKGVGDAMVGRAATAPLASVAGDTALAAVPGAAGGAVKESDGGAGLQLAAELASPIAAQTAAKAATKGVIGLGSKAAAKGFKVAQGILTDAGKERVAKEARAKAKGFVSKILGEEMTDTAKRNAVGAEALEKEIPGLNMALPARTKSQALATEQKALESKMSGAELEEAALRHTKNEAAIGNYAKRNGFDEPPSEIVDHMTGKVTRVQGMAGKQQAANVSEQEVAASGLPTIDKPSVGANLKRKELDLRAAASTQLSKEAVDTGALTADVTDELAGLVSRTQKRYTGFPTEAAPPTDILDKMTASLKMTVGTKDKTGATYTLNDLKKFRENLGREIRNAGSGAKQDRNRARELIILQKDVDDVFERVATNNPALKAWRAKYYEGYIKRFEDDAAFEVRKLNSRAFYVTNDEKIASTFFKAGDERAAQQFNAVFKGDKAAETDIVSHALDDLREFAVRNGVVDPAKLAKWVKDHRTVMDIIPAVKSAVKDVSVVTERLALRQAQLADRQDTIARTWITKVSGKEPEAAVKWAMGSPANMEKFMKSLNPKAKESARGIVWKDAADGTSAEMIKYMDDNIAVLEKMYDPEHFKALRLIQEARLRHEMVPAPTGKGVTVDPLKALEEKTGMGISQASSRFWAYVSGRMNKAYLVAEGVGRFMQGRARVETAALLKEALYNKGVAVDMAKEARIVMPSPKLSQRLNDALFRIGLGAAGKPHVATAIGEYIEGEE